MQLSNARNLRVTILHCLYFFHAYLPEVYLNEFIGNGKHRRSALRAACPER
jgi:hypothetical protein